MDDSPYRTFVVTASRGMDVAWIGEAWRQRLGLYCITFEPGGGPTPLRRNLERLGTQHHPWRGLVGGITAAAFWDAWLREEAGGADPVAALNVTAHPIRRIETLYRAYRHAFTDPAELDALPLPGFRDFVADWQACVDEASELAGRPVDIVERAFVRAAFDTALDLRDFRVPIGHVQHERLLTDIDYLADTLAEVTGGAARAAIADLRNMQAVQEAARAAADTRPVTEIMDEWGTMRVEVVRRLLTARGIDKAYGALGYDITGLTGAAPSRLVSCLSITRPTLGMQSNARNLVPRLLAAEADAVFDPRRLQGGDAAPIPVRRRLYPFPELPDTRPPGVLVSIHMQSNRPVTMRSFLDNLQDSVDDPASLEVVVKIDEGDEAMEALLVGERDRWSFTVKPVITPPPAGFYELWRAKNDTLKACDPNAYFLLDMNDEQRFLNKGWDTRLRRYVGLFPDHIYRVRTSLERFKEYHDFWEPGFSNDTSAFLTRRWIEVQGDWCPCNGPDSFQEYVAYYLGRNDCYAHPRPTRNLVANDIEISFEGPGRGLTGRKQRERWRGATVAWFTLVSHKMQEEASRRAGLIDAEIYACEWRLRDHAEIRDVRRRNEIHLYNKVEKKVMRRYRYGLSWLRITATNFYRRLYYSYYCGGGFRTKKHLISNFWHYLWIRYEFVAQMRMAWRDALYYPATPPMDHEGPDAHHEPTDYPALCRFLAVAVIRPYRKIGAPLHLVGRVGRAYVRDPRTALARTKRRLAIAVGRCRHLIPTQALASSCVDGAGRAFDGRTETWWSSGEQGPAVRNGAWIGAAYDQPVRLAHVVLQQTPNPPFRQDAIRIQWSDDGANWTDLSQQVPVVADLADIPVFAPRAARHWRLMAAGDNADRVAGGNWTPMNVWFWGR